MAETTLLCVLGCINCCVRLDLAYLHAFYTFHASADKTLQQTFVGLFQECYSVPNQAPICSHNLLPTSIKTIWSANCAPSQITHTTQWCCQIWWGFILWFPICLTQNRYLFLLKITFSHHQSRQRRTSIIFCFEAYLVCFHLFEELLSGESNIIVLDQWWPDV